ncbi:xmas [Carabus blaptoides fortunei]
MAKSKEFSKLDLKKLSVSCFNVPEALMDKTVAKHHFQRFGKVLRIRLKPKQKICIVEFSNELDAQRALKESGYFEDKVFRTSWTKYKNSSVETKIGPRSRNPDPDWTMDPDVRAELEAMKGTFTVNRTYNLRGEAMTVDEGPKKSLSNIKNTTVKSRLRKSEKSTNIKIKSDSVTSSSTYTTDQEQELLNIIMRVAQTSEEKYRILDARDKLIRLRTKSLRDLANVRRTVGTCTDMCPEKERLQRETQHQVAVYEQASGCKTRMNHAVAVKQYSRSSADQESPLAHELRPVEVLEMTMGYLLHRIMDLCDTTDVNLAEWYHFVWDRTRGIRKDITQQELCSLGSVTLVEQCARFHIHCSARLIAEDNSVFDEKINTENLTKCLQTLKYMYHDLPLSNAQLTCANEPEFRAYVILLNLNDANFMWEVQQLPSRIQQSPEIKFAIQVYSALDKNNYVKFFKLVRSTTYLNACILLRYFNQVRFKALRIIVKSYSPRLPYTTFPIAELSNLLAFEDEQNTIAFVEYHGLQLTRENTHVLLDRRMFRSPDVPFSLERAINVVESKRTTSVGEVICGHNLPEKIFLQHVPYNSFDENGRLKLLEVSKEWQPKYLEYLQQLPSEKHERQPNSGELFVDDMDVELDSYREVEKQSAEFRFSTPSLIVSDISKDKLNVNVPGFKFTAPTHIIASDTQDISEPDSVVIPSAIQVNVQENITQKNLTTVKPFWLNTVNPSGSIFSSNQNIFGNTVQNSQQAFVNNNLKIKTVDKEIPMSIGFSFLSGEKKRLEDNQLQAGLLPNRSEMKPVIPHSNLSVAVVPVVDQIESDSDEELRLMREQLLKTKRETEERELVRKAEEQRKLEQRKIEERLRQEKLARERRLILEVDTLLTEILVQVDQRVRANRLRDLEHSVQTHRLAECFNKWRDETRIAKKKRKCFFENATFLPDKSLETLANEMHTEHQDLTLNDMKRYKRGTAQQPAVHELVQLHLIDMCQTVWRILFEKLCGSGHLLQINVYWKIGLSLPTIAEDKYSSWYEKQMIRAFQLDVNMSTTKQYAINNGGCFVYNVKHVTGLENGLNGLLFFVNNIDDKTLTRLTSVIDGNQSMPIALIFGTNSNNTHDAFEMLQYKLSVLRSQRTIGTYKLIYSSMSDLQSAVVESLQWLASKVKKPLDLEMNALTSYLDSGIGEEFWDRIRSVARINRQFGTILTDPNLTINLHNEALRLLIHMTLDPEISTQPHFPTEFEDFVATDKILLPCSYEYFPRHWKSKSFVQRMKTNMEEMILPEYNYPWPNLENYQFHQSLKQYCTEIFNEDDSYGAYALDEQRNSSNVASADLTNIHYLTPGYRNGDNLWAPSSNLLTSRFCTLSAN